MNRRILFALLAAVNLHAEQHMVEYLLPRGGTRATTVDVSISGQHLTDAREVLFYSPGIKAVDIKQGAKPGEEVKLRFEIAPDCPVGEHVLRLRTATALSEAVTFWVSPFRTVYEAEKKIGDNDTLDKAQNIPINSTVEGLIQSGEQMDRDLYYIFVQQGQRISVEVEAARLGTLHIGSDNDLAVRILDSDGNELGKNDDSAMFVQDPLLSVVAPRTGTYYVEIMQQLFTPMKMAYYRAHIGTFSRPTGIYPAGGQAGQQINVRVLGDPLGERTEQITLPAKPGNFEYFAGPKGE